MLPHIYGWSLTVLAAMAVAAIVAAACVARVCARAWRRGGRRAFRGLCVALLAVLAAGSVVAVLGYTVLGREPTGGHRFAWFMDPAHNEFVREMFMNALLYVPLGVCLPFLLSLVPHLGARRWLPFALSVLFAFALSAGIEAWQYLAGTGLSQGSDVLCNTLGAAVGGLAYLGAKRGRGKPAARP